MSTATDAPKKMSIAELRNYDGPLWVENMTLNYISVNQKFGRDDVRFHLEPKGQSGCIDEMPKLALSIAGFRKMILRGDVRVSTDENMQERIELQIQQDIEAEKLRAAGVLETVQENGSSRDLVEKTCLHCGAMIFQSVKDIKAGVHPLCPTHTDLSHQYPATLTTNDQGVEEWKFSRPNIIQK